MPEVAPKPAPMIDGERAPNAKELSLWRRARILAKRTRLRAYVVQERFKLILLAHKFAQENKIDLGEPDLADWETRMLSALDDIEKLSNVMCKTNRLQLGVRVSESGNDLDILEPPVKSLGWVIPVVIGAVVVAGIIARWAYLETESQKISDHFNGVLRRADLALCKDPNSKTCKDWQTTKATGGYKKKQTLIGAVETAIDKIGTGAKTGLSFGIALAIPVLIFLFLPRKKE